MAAAIATVVVSVVIEVFLAVITVQIVVVILILVAVWKSFSWDSIHGNRPDDNNIGVYLLMTLNLFMYSQ